MDEINERMTRLERANRLWRSLALGAILLAGITVAAGAAFNGSDPGNLVKGRRYELYTGSRLEATWESGVLTFFDAQGRKRSQFHGGGMSAWDENNNLKTWIQPGALFLFKDDLLGERVAIVSDRVNLIDAGNHLKASLGQGGVTVYGLKEDAEALKQSTPDPRQLPRAP